MKDLKIILLEKLHINKDISKQGKEIKYLTDLYEVGDKCFFIRNRGIQSQERITLDIVEILSKTKTILRYKYLTNINTDISSNYLEINRKTNLEINKYKCAFTSGTSSINFLLPVDISKEVLETIKREPKLDIYFLLYKDVNDKSSNRLTPVMELKSINLKPHIYDNYKLLTKETIDKYDNCLNS